MEHLDKDKATIAAYDRLAQVYQDKFMDMDLYDDTYDAFFDLLPQSGASVLDVGCGPGMITRYLYRKRPDFQFLGIDAGPNMIALAKANVPEARFEVMDARAIGTLPEKFDGIISGFCLPYLSISECNQFFADTHSLLHSGGILYFSVIEDSASKSGWESSSDGKAQFHVYYHEADYLLEGVRANGFEVVDVMRKSYPKGEGKYLLNLIVLARKI